MGNIMNKMNAKKGDLTLTKVGELLLVLLAVAVIAWIFIGGLGKGGSEIGKIATAAYDIDGDLLSGPNDHCPNIKYETDAEINKGCPPIGLITKVCPGKYYYADNYLLVNRTAGITELCKVKEEKINDVTSVKLGCTRAESAITKDYCVE